MEDVYNPNNPSPYYTFLLSHILNTIHYHRDKNRILKIIELSNLSQHFLLLLSNLPLIRFIFSLYVVKVFDDTGIARDIGNLQVTCSKNDIGCIWSGDLRNIQVICLKCSLLKSTCVYRN